MEKVRSVMISRLLTEMLALGRWAAYSPAQQIRQPLEINLFD